MKACVTWTMYFPLTSDSKMLSMSPNCSRYVPQITMAVAYSIEKTMPVSMNGQGERLLLNKDFPICCKVLFFVTEVKHLNAHSYQEIKDF